MTKKRNTVRTSEDRSPGEQSTQDRDGAAEPRDLKTEDAGVPRGDWSDDPLQSENPDESRENS